MGARGAGHRARRAERAAAPARPAFRARRLHRQPRHHRRDDGEQLERRPVGALRQDDRPRHRAGGRAVGRLRRHVRTDWPRASSRGSAPATRSRPRCYRTVARTGGDDIATRSSAGFPRCCVASAATTSTSSSTGDARSTWRKLMVGSEGTLGVVLSAKVNLVPLPRAKAVLAIQFASLLESLAAAPVILEHRPSAVEVMDKSSSITRGRALRSRRMRQSFIEGDPGALLCVEFYADRAEDLPPRLAGARTATCARTVSAIAITTRSIWRRRRASGACAKRRSGLSMAMKDDAKSLSFVEDTAVAPERLRDYIERFLAHRRAARHDGRRLRACVGRLPARSAGRQHEDRGRRAAVRGDRQRRLRSGAGVRRRAFGRARRRAGAQPVHGEDVRTGALRGVPHHQADLRSARHLQSRQDRRCAAAHGQPALRAGVLDADAR